MTEVSKRGFMGAGAAAALAAAFSPAAVAAGVASDWSVPASLQQEMYAKALQIARSKVRGGPGDPAYPKPFVDAAFSAHIFVWDTCFIAAYAKYHPDVLPIANALDNFYQRQDADGFICREYDEKGRPFWPKDHPVSINPPLFAFAELELYGRSHDAARLRAVYPTLTRFFDFLMRTYRAADGLFFSDALGSGMDNIPRYPAGWSDDGKGIALHNLYPAVFDYKGASAEWNRQGRSVDFSAQMALFADQLAQIARLIGRGADASRHAAAHDDIARAINLHCWDETEGFYFDQGYGKPIRQKHVGMFWTLWAGVAPPEWRRRLLLHLIDTDEFWRTIPVATFSADQPLFAPEGNYWLGSVWAPTNYMVLRGLERIGERALAVQLARRYYWAVAQVYKATGTFWENYAPDSVAKGSIARGDFCGWTGLVPIAIYREYINPQPST